MKNNFINSMLGEGGSISHKRFISVLFSLVAATCSAYVMVKYKDLFTTTFNSILLFIAIMSGVATVAQIVSIIKGTPPPKDEENEKTN